ncbi:biotin--[acetyl-CoA-carboxylase] ligase [Tsukamurella soli]|uniref:biotin--[biotin carboxyl-carrier protein] ligase n=1 Tax=Tsukamurella soli TaxID=644556 RepID=A0ABP8K095_9ACTN
MLPENTGMLPDRTAIAAVLPPRWRDVTVVASTGSTNVDLADGIRAGEAAGRVLIADLQTAGRGRHARPWSAPAGTQLAISVTVGVPERAAHRLGWLPLATGTAAVRAVTGVAASLKWPNDLLLDGGRGGRSGKGAGILAELVVPATGGEMVAVIGMGLNATLTEEQLPVPTATSLALAGAEAPDRTRLAVAYLTELDRALTLWADDPAAARAAYLAVCDTVGRAVTVALPDGGVLAGTAVDVDTEGRVVVRADDGDHSLSAGDVTHLRPA